MSKTQPIWLSATGVGYQERLHSHVRLASLGKGRAKGEPAAFDLGGTQVFSVRRANVKAEAEKDLKNQAPELTAESLVEDFEFFKPTKDSSPLLKARKVQAKLLSRKFLSFPNPKIQDVEVFGHPLQIKISRNFQYPFRNQPVNGRFATLVESLRWKKSDGPSLDLGGGFTGRIEGNAIQVLRGGRLVAEIRVGVVRDMRPDPSANGDPQVLSAEAAAEAAELSESGPEEAALTMLAIRASVDPYSGELQPIRAGGGQPAEGGANLLALSLDDPPPPEGTTTSVGDVQSDGGDPDGHNGA